MDSETISTGIQTHTGFFPLAFILFACKPVIQINDKKVRTSWGTRFYELDPGEYTVKIYFKYMWMSECGANSVKVTVKPGEVKKVNYNMPPWMLAKGTMKVS